ncbi:unnamed protein product [Lactuca virosa]|uniref:Uncharacterized protein n=1 Tax=Lactuca virosa TaxID=75947 RepID=A0AAU9MX99_9ASTR|nr:unnamed protein product [Lactuca virosa]
MTPTTAAPTTGKQRYSSDFPPLAPPLLFTSATVSSVHFCYRHLRSPMNHQDHRAPLTATVAAALRSGETPTTRLNLSLSLISSKTPPYMYQVC